MARKVLAAIKVNTDLDLVNQPDTRLRGETGGITCW